MNYATVNLILTTLFIDYFILTLILTLSNKFNSKIVLFTLNENSNNLLTQKKYTKSTLKTIKLSLILRSLFFILGLILEYFYSYGFSFLLVTSLIFFVYFSNIKIEKQLQLDFENWNENNKHLPIS